MGAKESMLEFAREPAGGGYGRAWCSAWLLHAFPGFIPRGNAAHAAFQMLPNAVEWTHLSSYSRA